jgi:hypothetical protein
VTPARRADVNHWLETNRATAGWILFGVALLLVGSTLTSPGVTWDEPWYFGSAQLQVLWLEKLLSDGPAAALDPAVVMEMWDWQHYYNPHPPLYKEWMAATWWATHHVIGPLAGLRLAPALLFSGLVLLAFRWGTAAWSGIAGLGGALSILLQPRLFGHAHFAATETPLMTFWMAATAAAWWGIERDRKAGWILAGAFWGLAMGTKFTGVAALGPVVLYGLWRAPRRTLVGAGLATAMAVCVFWILNPMLWVAPRQFLGTWLWESLHRADYVPIFTFYMGRQFSFDVPWHHVFVMTAVVVPVGISILATLGTAAGWRRRDPLVVLCAGSVGFVWLLFLLPRSPHHDGVRQFIMLFPFLAMIAGYGLHRAWEVVGTRLTTWILVVAFLPPAAQLLWIHPYYLSYYSEIVGGLRGAHALGFETTYWQDAYAGPVLDFLNAELPEDATVFVNGETLALVFQQGIGRLRRDLRFTNRLPSDYVLAQMRRSTRGEDLLPPPRYGPPAYLLQHQGVPLVVIYRFRDGMIPEYRLE